MVNLIINWSSLTYSVGDAVKATIRVKDTTGLPPSDFAWVLYRNNVQIASGTSTTVSYQTSSPGTYRLKATATDREGTTVTANSAVAVGGGFEIQASPIPPEVDPTCVYLGALYTDEVTGAGGPTDSLPYQLASYTQNVYLLPGTTHISFDLDPNQNEVDDEVVVRTPTGNYTLIGTPGGLYDESIGYDYIGGQPLLVAPADGVLRLTLEAFNVHGATAGAFNFRVRVKCWQQGDPVYQYVKCAGATLPGGVGKRHRQFAALITEMTIQTDVESTQGSPATNVYTTPEVTSIPLTTLSVDGSPNPIQAATGMFLTDSNCYAIYEPNSDDLPELTAKAVAGQDGLRPFYLTLDTPAAPPIIQRIKRLQGRLIVYMSQGALTAGSVINLRIKTGKLTNGLDEVAYSVPVTEDVYNNQTDVYQKVAGVAIDLSDFQFSDNGLVIFFDVDESNATETALPCDDPDPIAADDYIYSKLNAAGVIYDGACYTRPVVQPTVATDAYPGAGGITGCHELACGPVGLYCYTDVATGSIRGDFPQPLYFPSPYVSYGTDPLNCFGDPVLLHEITGTGSTYMPLFTNTTDALCGDGYVYNVCAGGGDLRSMVVYPHNTVPHDVVYFGSMCWTLFSGTAVAGTTAVRLIGTRGWEVISAGSVEAVPSCIDDLCTGTVVGGTSVIYYDDQTDQTLPVRFEGLDDGVPYIGVSAQVQDSGLGDLPRGQKNVTFTTPRVFLFTCNQGGQVDFNFGLADFAKRIVVVRGGASTSHEIRIGNTQRIVTLQAGDQVYADIGNQIGILSDRTRNKRTVITWRPIITLPRRYHTAVITTTGTNQVRSLGFTGLTNRDAYTRFETLPADVEQAFPNPDNIVTVTGASGVEYVLVRTRAIGDAVPPLPGNTQWYSGEILNDSLTFKFYTSREDQGAHGEMDVWLNRDGAFPVYFKVDPYRTLRVLGGDVDVLILVSTQSSFADPIRSGVAALHQKLLDSGSDPRYAFIKCSPTPSPASGANFREYNNFVALSAWTDSNMPDNFGNPEAGLTTIWSSGTLFNWRDGSSRLYLFINNFSAWDFPPGFWTPTSNENYVKAQAVLSANESIMFSIINPTQNVPITPSTFVIPGNVPQTYMPLAEETGGKWYVLSQFGTEPGPIAEEIGMLAQSQFFATRVDDSITDISRNSLRVASTGTEFLWPNEYVAADGERIVTSGTAYGTISYGDKLFTFLDSDPGISSRIIPGSAVTPV